MSSPLKDAVVAHMAAHGGGDGVYRTAIDGLAMMRSSAMLPRSRCLIQSALDLGSAKWAALGVTRRRPAGMRPRAPRSIGCRSPPSGSLHGL